MDIRNRIRICLLLRMMRKNKRVSCQLGLRDASNVRVFKKEEK